MGIKLGFAGLASKRNLFISLNAKEHPFTLAQVFFLFEEDGSAFGRAKCYLLYPDGSIGLLSMNNVRQLSRSELIVRDWVMTKEQCDAINGTLPMELVMFSGEYTARDFSMAELLPKAEHTSDDERFNDPQDPWTKAVAHCLLE